VALDQHYITQIQFDQLYAHADEAGRLIGGFMKYLQQSNVGGHKFIRAH
jgi:hypothetical protein